MIKQFLLAIVFIFTFSTLVYADDMSSPVGEWITISDKTHDKSGIVKLYEHQGKLYGKVMKIFPGDDRDPNERCVKCEGSFKDQPVLGMTFLWGFVRQSDGSWKEGQVLDPKEGHVYRGSIKLIENGEKLEVRGYWGIFWRTQTWIRVK